MNNGVCTYVQSLGFIGLEPPTLNIIIKHSKIPFKNLFFSNQQNMILIIHGKKY